MSILIVSGPPGAGKSTVARLVAGAYDPSVCLESDWFWTTFVNGFIEPWEPASRAQNEAVMRATFAASRELSEGGYHVFVDGLVGPWFIPLALEAVGPATRLGYVVLRPDEDTCVARATTRPATERIAGHPPLRDPEPIRQLWHQLADLGDHEHHALDTSTLTAEETTSAVLEGHAAGRYDLR